MPWHDAPAKQMRELISAMRAVWANWYEGEPLKFRGDYYQHTLMTPMFTPTNTQYGAPKVFLAAVGPVMTQVAGEVADGMIVHAFTTEAYLRQVTLPALDKGFAKAGRRREEFQIAYPCFVVTGSDEKSFAEAKATVTKQIAFYGSTPAYKGVLDSIGAGELQGVLNAMSKEGKWVEMGELITDDILKEFAGAEPKDVAAGILSRYGDIVDRTSAAYSSSRGGAEEDHRRSEGRLGGRFRLKPGQNASASVRSAPQPGDAWKAPQAAGRRGSSKSPQRRSSVR